MKKGEKIILGIGAVLLLDFLVAKVNKPKIFIVDNLPLNYNAQTIPPFGIYIKRNHSKNPKLIQHEMIHWKQYKKTGAIIFYLKYLAQKSLYGYDKMPMEIESRIATGENTKCLYNYTKCVKNGNSSTIYNPNFRVAV